jgi:hypothetical protein
MNWGYFENKALMTKFGSKRERNRAMEETK